MNKIYFKPSIEYSQRRKSAYTLLEMSLVILIVSVLITGGIAIATSSINNTKKDLTNKRLTVIYDAMGRFLAKNNRLPCPASLTKTKSESGYGHESAGDCLLTADAGVYSSVDKRNIVIGMVPINSLGLSDEFAEDGFGSKINYVVNSHLTLDDNRVIPLSSNDDSSEEDDPLSFAASDDDQRRGFGLFSQSDSNSMSSFSVFHKGNRNKIDEVAFAIFSNGPNKNGSFPANSSTQERRIGSNSDFTNVIRERADGIVPAISSAKFGGIKSDDLIITNSHTNSDSFDDIVLFKSRMELVTDFDLARLIPCVPNENMKGQGFEVVYAGDLSIGDSCEFQADVSPIKECGPLGSSWITKVDCPSSFEFAGGSDGLDLGSSPVVGGD